MYVHPDNLEKPSPSPFPPVNSPQVPLRLGIATDVRGMASPARHDEMRLRGALRHEEANPKSNNFAHPTQTPLIEADPLGPFFALSP